MDKLIPLPHAAERLGVTVEVLTKMITSFRIKANVTEEGEILITESEMSKVITREQFDDLRGTPITVAQAIEKYGLNSATWSRYISAGLVTVLTPGYGMKLDEADIAYCYQVYQVLGGKSGSRLFDKDGNPYRLKYPDVAAHRKERIKNKHHRIRA